jgi:hypothetical protein
MYTRTVLTVLVLCVAGCGSSTTTTTSSPGAFSPKAVSRLTKEAFLSIKHGMYFSDVKLILGEPTRQETLGPPVQLRCYWVEGDREISVYFNDPGVNSPFTVINKNQKGLAP